MNIDLYGDARQNVFTFEECRAGHPDDHWYRTPLCQRIITIDRFGDPCPPRTCDDDDWVFEHNDIVNEDVMHLKHEMVVGDPLTDENTRRRNNCRGYVDHSWETDAEGKYTHQPDDKCDCRCHWGEFYVNAYEIDKLWGGPEEGGWWYDAGYPVASVPFGTLREAETFRETLRERFPSNGKVNSVIYSGGDYSIRIEQLFARPYPDQRPRYE